MLEFPGSNSSFLTRSSPKSTLNVCIWRKKKKKDWRPEYSLPPGLGGLVWAAVADWEETAYCLGQGSLIRPQGPQNMWTKRGTGTLLPSLTLKTRPLIQGLPLHGTRNRAQQPGSVPSRDFCFQCGAVTPVAQGSPNRWHSGEACPFHGLKTKSLPHLRRGVQLTSHLTGEERGAERSREVSQGHTG